MKLPFAILLLAAVAASAQTNKPTFIRGEMEIQFNSRTKVVDGKPAPGAVDTYRLILNVSDSAVFRGTIAFTPFIDGTFGVVQPAALNYTIDCDVVNPANPQQTKNIGKMFGVVPIEPTGLYRFGGGNLKIAVRSVGRAQEFESRFNGTAQGKPLVKQSAGFFEKIRREAVSIRRNMNGKTVSIVVKNSDRMRFTNHVLAAGPVQFYPEATVNGDMVYDYDRNIWFFTNVSINYSVDGVQMVDKLTGNIRWIESPNRKANGEGEYQFDVRVNEAPPKEADAFKGATDESAFFQTDSTASSLTGTMKYNDTLAADTVVASGVKIDLVGQNLTRQQTMNLAKLILLSSIVPLNAE